MKVFLTAAELIEHVKENYPSDPNENTSLQDTLWFVCVQDARGLADGSLKDIASMLLDGIKPYGADPIASIQYYLDTYYEELKTEISEGNVLLSMGEIDHDDMYDMIPLFEEHFNGIVIRD